MSAVSERAALLIEIVCEEIPARAIASASREFLDRVAAILDAAGLARGPGTAWGGTRRLAVRFEAVEGGLPPRGEEVLGPPASVAFRPDGSPTPALHGFARKQGIDVSLLRPTRTPKGEYAGFRREVPGRSLEAILGEHFASSVAAIPFPKTMRWGDGTHRWVRPVHALVALHGARALEIPLFDVVGGRRSLGHRFLAPGGIDIPSAAAYEETLRGAKVLVDPEERKVVLARRLGEAAREAGGEWVRDDVLLDEVAASVEWPGVVTGRFDPAFLDLPRELLVTTLRHHQKSFTVERAGELLPVFLSVANTDADVAGHVRRGNEWVVSGRLADARFFWDEDRKRTLASRVADLERVTFHAALGSYGAKSLRVGACVRRLAERLGVEAGVAEAAERAAVLAKADLTTGLVGEFPELQGIVGGLLLEAEGADPAVARGVYEQYRPAGAEDLLPTAETAALVSVADRLDTLGGLLGAGERPTGSRDPFGLRRAANGVFRIVIDRGWSVAIRDLADLAGGGDATLAFLRERLENFLRDEGATANEAAAVLGAAGGDAAIASAIPDLLARLAALRGIRGRDDFAHLADLVKRVANILRKNAALAAEAARGSDESPDPEPAVAALAERLGAAEAEIAEEVRSGNAAGVVDVLSRFVEPVERFFDEALVIDPASPQNTRSRLRLLQRLESTLTGHFDLRELPGAADRSG
jgi:glycyl-tRNA synthetase beta chain